MSGIAAEGLPPLKRTFGGIPLTNDAWTSIDNLIDKLTGELKVGEMVHDDDNFSLHHAMSATELMDPKMDLGMGRVNIVPMQERLDEGRVRFDLTLVETVRILDMVFGYEYLHYFQGYSFAQTLHTCFYAHKVVLSKLQALFSPSKPVYPGDRSNISNNGDDASAAMTLANLKISDNTVRESLRATLARILHAYIVAVIKTAKLIQEKVLEVDIYEEDDYHPRTYGVYMGDDIDESTLVGLLKAAELSAMKYCNEEASKDTSPIIAQKGMDTKIERSLWDGIITRLQFRLNLYKGYANMSDANRLVNDKKCLDASLANFENCRKLLATMVSSKEINEGVIWPLRPGSSVQVDAVSSVKPGDKKTNLTEVEQLISTMAFDADLAAEVMRHAPPHAFDPVKFSETCSTFTKSVDDTIFVLGASRFSLSSVSKHRKASDLHKKQTTATRFPSIDSVDPLTHLDLFLQEMSRRNCDLIVRTFLSSMLKVKDNVFGLGSITGIAIASLKAFGVPSWMTDNAEEGLPCLTKICNALIYYWRTMCLGPARQHRRLLKVLKDWGNLQYHADFHDQQLLLLYNVPLKYANQYINRFGSWVLSRGLLMMIHQLELGLWNNLYSVEDNISVLWYTEQLIMTSSQNFTACVEMYRKSEFFNPTGKYKNEIYKLFGGKKAPLDGGGGNESKKKKKKKKKSSKKPEELKATPFHVYILNYLHARKAEVSGLFEALIALRKGGMTDDIRTIGKVDDETSFGSAEFRYNARFKHFYVFDQQPPQSFSYQSYANSIYKEENEKGDVEAIMKSSIELLKKAVAAFKNCQAKLFENLQSELYIDHFDYKRKQNVTNFVTLSKILRDTPWKRQKESQETPNRVNMTLTPQGTIGEEMY